MLQFHFRNQFLEEMRYLCMALHLQISDIVSKASALYPDTNTKLLTTILQKMRTHKDFGAYGFYTGITQPTGAARKAMGDALFGLWAYCNDQDLPLFNFLVTLKGSGLPGTGVEEWYKGKFGDLNSYDEYCIKQGEIAKFVLEKGIVVLL
jgi:hypothetical protein